MKIIGFTGKMGSGKSTAIAWLKDLYDGPVINVKFAQPMYDIQKFVYDRIKSVYTKPEGFIKDRKLLQWLGTDWGRSIDKDLWVKLWCEDVWDHIRNVPGVIVVCDDVRFDNEAEAVKDLGGYIIKLEAPSRCDTSLSSHASENGIDLRYIDAIIENTGSLEDLKSSLQAANTTLAIW